MRFEAQARRVVAAFDSTAVLVDTASRRQVIDTTLSPGVPGEAAAPALARVVLKAEEHLVTDLVMGPAMARPGIAIAVPVVRGDRIPFVLALQVDPEAFRRVLMV